MQTFRVVQGKPDSCPFKDYKCPHSGESKTSVLICDIPLKDRHKYLDPSQDVNDPRMRRTGDYKIDIVNPMEVHKKEIDGLNTTINAMLEHLKQLTTAVNKISK